MATQERAYKLPPLNILMFLVETGIIVLSCLYLTRVYMNWSEQVRISGNEFSYWIESGAVAATVFHKTGRIPLWNPFLATGEPMLESPFSFIFNPFQFLPIMAFGVVNGTKLNFIIDSLLMGLGGWLLGRILRFHTAGRLLMGLLFGSSGSLVSAMWGGQYLFAGSMVYIPWILAGLIGSIYLRRRWLVGLLAISTTLLIFAGSYWYVLPMIIACALITVFQLIYYDAATHSYRINSGGLQRLVLAAGFVILIAAIQIVPQFVHSQYFAHPAETLQRVDSFDLILGRYFTPEITPQFELIALYYHYVTPVWFGVLVIIAALLVSRPWHNAFTSQWRILVPALILAFFFTVWGEGGVPFILWMYDTFAFVRNWRNLGRILAVGSAFVILILSALFDYVITALWRQERRLALSAILRPLTPYFSRLRAAGLALMIVGAALAVADIETNWDRLAGLDPNNASRTVEGVSADYLRSKYPGAFLSLSTGSDSNYIPLYANLIRAQLGNSQGQAGGLPPTYGIRQSIEDRTSFLTGYPQDWYQGWNAVAVPDAPYPDQAPVLYYDATRPPYAYWLMPDVLKNRPIDKPVTAQEVTPVQGLYHRIDSVAVDVNNYTPGALLVVTEVDYPGWQVTVNGQPAQLESVGEHLGVLLPPPDGNTVEVVFEYKPTVLYASAVIAGIGVLLMCVYLLRLDLRIPISVRRRVRQQINTTAAQVFDVLQDTKFLEEQEDEEPLLLPLPPEVPSLTAGDERSLSEDEEGVVDSQDE